MLLPDILEEIDYETLKSDTIALLKGFLDVEFLESDEAMLIIEALLYREMLLRARVNNSLRASYLFTATGSDLDNIVTGFKVIRLELESDEALRARALLSLNQFSTAGARGSYMYWAKSVSSDIKEVTVLTPTAGTVEIVYSSNIDYTLAIYEACNSDEVRPLCDTVVVTKSTVKTVDVALGIEILNGYDIILIRQSITEAFANLSLGIGDDLPLSKIYDTAHVEGVYRITSTLNFDIIANEREVIQPNIIFN